MRLDKNSLVKGAARSQVQNSPSPPSLPPSFSLSLSLSLSLCEAAQSRPEIPGVDIVAERKTKFSNGKRERPAITSPRVDSDRVRAQ